MKTLKNHSSKKTISSKRSLKKNHKERKQNHKERKQKIIHLPLPETSSCSFPTLRSVESLNFNKYKQKKDGWIIIEIHGNAYQRGFSHGELLYKELQKVLYLFPFIVKTELNITYNKYIKFCSKLIKPKIIKYYPEFYEEMMGIVNGAFLCGTKIDIDTIIAWNAVPSFYDYFVNVRSNQKQNKIYRCSAFIATGSATINGKIVMGHNTHCDFITAQTQNIILYVYPTTGHPFVMQTSAGYIASGIDWFITSNGFVGCETTISDLKHKPKFKFGIPYFCRIRQAMQYGKTLDEYSKIMLQDNAGDYACSWLFGNIHTNEIMLLDLGVNSHNIEKKKDGFFYGMNTPLNVKFRKEETNDNDIYDIRTSSGSRNIRLKQLLETKKININYAKEILSDHYDEYENKQHRNSSSICKHGELEHEETTRNAYYPFGCTDGKVIDYEMAKNMKFIGRFGSCCGRIFSATQFIKKHSNYKRMEKYLPNFPYRKWVSIGKPNALSSN